MKRNKDILNKNRIILLLIVLFGLSLRLIFFSGVGISDDLAYSRFAHDIDKGLETQSGLTLSTRMGIIYATSFSYKLLGINDFSSVLFVLLASLGNIVLAYFFGKLLFNQKIALASAFLISFFPLEVVYSTKLLTDLPSAFFMALGVYVFLYAELKAKKAHRILYLASGLSIGAGYFIRESALLIALFFIAYILYNRKIKVEYLLVPLGVLIVLGIESFIFFKLTGDPFFRSSMSQKYLEEASNFYNNFNRLDFPKGMFHYPYMILTSGLVSYYYILAFAAILYFVVMKRKENYAMMLWFLPLLAYLSFGSGSLTRYVPFKATERYLSIITFPCITLIAAFLHEKKIAIGRLRPIIILFLFAASIFSVYARDDRHLLDNLRQLYPYLKNLDKTIYIDKRSMQALDYISSYGNELNTEEYPSDLRSIKDSYIVINREMIRNLKEANKRLEFPAEIDRPPNSWTAIEVIGKEEKNRITVYYAR